VASETAAACRPNTVSIAEHISPKVQRALAASMHAPAATREHASAQRAGCCSVRTEEIDGGVGGGGADGLQRSCSARRVTSFFDVLQLGDLRLEHLDTAAFNTQLRC
jgi:hypothetical protein